jgi:hypothetical protein
MFSLADIPDPIALSKDFTADQTYLQSVVELGTASATVGANGIGTAGKNSVIVLLAPPADQRVTLTLKYVAPSASGDAELGAVLRYQTSASDATKATYYYARIKNGSAYIIKVVAGTFTTIAGPSAWAVTVGTTFTLVFEVVGSALTATFSTAALADKVLTTTDSAIPGGGVPGARTLLTAGYLMTAQAEYL